MLHKIIPDTPTYLSPISNGHPLAQAYYWLMRPLGLEAAALVQTGFGLWAAWRFNESLWLNRYGAWLASLGVLWLPALYWGPQIGSDALGYAFFLLALSVVGKPWKYAIIASLAALTRFQYIALFGGLLTHKRWAWLSVVVAVALGWVAWSGWMGMAGMYGKVYKTVEYLECAKPIKPSDMAEAEFFNMVWGGHYSDAAANLGCASGTLRTYGTAGTIKRHWKGYLSLLKSKVRYTFRFHALAVFALLLTSVVWRQAFIFLAMYGFVLLTSTTLYMQYTLGIEAVMISLFIKLYDGRANEKSI